MMAKTDDPPQSDGEADGVAARLIKAALAVVGLMFFLGIGVGIAAAAVQGKDLKPAALILGAASLLMAACCGWALVRLRPLAADGPVSPRILKARRAVGMSGAIGVVLGMILSLSTLSSGDPWGALGNGPVPAWAAILAIVIWLGVVPLLSWRWWRSIDEHEASAYRFGTLVGMYAYAFLTPTWWMGWRGGFLPEPQSMIIFLTVIAIWGGAWLTRRSA